MSERPINQRTKENRSKWLLDVEWPKSTQELPRSSRWLPVQYVANPPTQTYDKNKESRPYQEVKAARRMNKLWKRKCHQCPTTVVAKRIEGADAIVRPWRGCINFRESAPSKFRCAAKKFCSDLSGGKGVSEFIGSIRFSEPYRYGCPWYTIRIASIHASESKAILAEKISCWR